MALATYSHARAGGIGRNSRSSRSLTGHDAARSIHAHMIDTVLIGAVTLFAWIGTIVAAMWALVTLNRIHTHLKAVRTQLDRVERAITQTGLR